MNMSPRNLVILFFSTVAVSLVLLIIVFSLFFKNMDFSFDTRMPDMAPDLGRFYKDGQPSQTRGDTVGGANVRVPGDEGPRAPQSSAETTSGLGDENLSEPEPLPSLVRPESDAPDADDDDADRPVESPARPQAKTPASAPPAPATPGLAPVKPLSPAASKPAPSRPTASPRIDPEAGGGNGPKAPTPPPASGAAPAPAKTTAAYQVYLDGFESREAAQAKRDQMAAQGQGAIVKPAGNGFIVQLGVFGTRDNAGAAAQPSGAKIRKLN